MTEKDRPNCYQCKYRGTVPGDAHSCCRYPGNEIGLFEIFAPANKENATKLNIRVEYHGIRNGWFMWPINFDPAWLTNCDGFQVKEVANADQ